MIVIFNSNLSAALRGQINANQYRPMEAGVIAIGGIRHLVGFPTANQAIISQPFNPMDGKPWTALPTASRKIAPWVTVYSNRPSKWAYPTYILTIEVMMVWAGSGEKKAISREMRACNADRQRWAQGFHLTRSWSIPMRLPIETRRTGQLWLPWAATFEMTHYLVMHAFGQIAWLTTIHDMKRYSEISTLAWIQMNYTTTNPRNWISEPLNRWC